ncbi:MAG TPA: type II CAAX endopeptidase family protein [Tepiditoga sp.]|nr:type II CAAX endopeptidase family protein [Tepiditoga sp.]
MFFSKKILSNVNFINFLISLGIYIVFIIFITILEYLNVPAQITSLLNIFTNSVLLYSFIFIVLRKSSVNFKEVFKKPVYEPEKFFYFKIIFSALFINYFILLVIIFIPDDIRNFIIKELKNNNYPEILKKTQPFFTEILKFILIVILGPISEEIIFRGFLLGKIAKRFNIYAGVIISSLIFGFLHPQFISKFLIGIILCIVFLKAQSLKTTIKLHMIINFAAYIISFINIDNFYDNYLFITFLIIAPIISAFYIYQIISRNPIGSFSGLYKEPEKEGEECTL